MTWIAIAAGGALGALARHGVHAAMHGHWALSRFPAGTVAVNVSGCFVIGLLAGLLSVSRITLPFYWREFVFVGLLGGFTTFSTFGIETFLLARTHSQWMAFGNIAAQVCGGLAAVWCGHQLGMAFGGRS